MHPTEYILGLLSLLDSQTADDLESETLDVKECADEERLRELARDMAICLGNGSGGTVVFGVRDRVIGQSNAIVQYLRQT